MVPPRPEFIPVGKLVESSRQLDIDFHTQQDFVFDMKSSGRELENGPLARPAFRNIVLDRVPLLSELGKPRGTDKLWLNFSEDNEGRRNAVIQLYIGSMATQFHLAATNDKWRVYSEGRSASDQYLANVELVEILARKLRDDTALTSLTDRVDGYDGMIIPHLLNDALYEGVPETDKEKHVVFTTNESIVQGFSAYQNRNGEPAVTPEYLSSVKTFLSVDEKKGSSTHQLVTRAAYDVDGRSILKEYAYKAVTSRRSYGPAGGRVAMSSRDGMTRQQVEDYALRDQVTNEPIHSLRRGLDTLRASQGLRKIS